MDLEVVGRHALLFDDDANAAFVNSGDALVEWHSLQIDRYDVRHLLSAPPPSRRRCSNLAIEPVVSKDLSLESQLDHERYLDLPSNDDLPDAEHGKHQPGAGYSAVGFSYGSTDDSSYSKNTDIGVEASGFIPHFPVPDNLLHSLPPTEKLHQIIARTAMFVSKHGGQSEIILRLKQEDNPMFGFLMPGHQLHAYFRYLVEHPEFLNPASGGSPQVDGKEAGNQSLSSDIGGALSLLGSMYGSGEDDEGHDIEITTKDISHDHNSAIHNLSPRSKNIQSQTDVGKDESVSRNQVPSNKEGVLTAKKNPSVIAAKSKSVKGVEGESYLVYAKANKVKRAAIGLTSKIAPVILDPPPAIKRWIDKFINFIMVNGKLFDASLEQDCVPERLPFLVPSDKYHSYYLKALERARESIDNDKGLSRSVKGKEGESSLVSVDADKVKRTTTGITSKIDPVILEPPVDVKRLIDKLIKFIMVKGKLFEATLEQDSMLQNLSFLLPSDKYHPYYLKALERARESKLNGKGLYREMDDPSGPRLGKQASVLKEKNSAFFDLAWDSDKKEKFKMVIGRSKKETQEAESKGANEDYGIPVDAAAAAAILQAATRGIKQSILQPNSSTSSTLIHVSGEDRHPGNLGNFPSQGENTGAKDHTESPNGYDVRTAAVELTSDAHSSETHLTKEQKLKAERLKKAKMFVAKLKNGDVPVKTETLRGASSEPLENGIVRSACKVDVDVKERGGSIMTPMDIDGLATGEKLDRNYFGEEHTQRLLKRKYRSRSGHGDDGEDDGDLMEHDKPCSKGDCRSRSKEQGKDLISSSEDGESSEEDRDHKSYRSKHQSHHSIREDKHDDKHKKDKNHKRSRKKHHSDSSPHRHSRRHRSSKKHLQEDVHDYDDRERGHSRRKHHSHHSSHHDRDKYGHGNEHPFRDDESRSNHKRGSSSSGDECSNQGGMNKHRKTVYSERNELEEGEICSRKSEESRGISVGHAGREASVDVVSSCQRAQSRTSETTTEVPDDFRAKIRAMLMATHL